MFKFVVKRLRWLARIPVLPQLFDAGLVRVPLAERTLFRDARIVLAALAFLSEQRKSVIFMETACSTCLSESHFGPTR